MKGIFQKMISVLKTFYHFSVYTLTAFIDHHSMRTAASLSYTSLLSLVPLMTVVAVIFTGFPEFEAVEKEIEAFIFKNFVPSLGITVADYLREFSTKAAGLGSAAMVVFVFIVLSLMATIEGALNTIWSTGLCLPWVPCSSGPVSGSPPICPACRLSPTNKTSPI